MVVINTIVLILAVTWIAMAFFNTYVRLRAEDTVSLPAFALTMMFTLGVVVLLLLGFAPVHLLWWLPLSALLAAGLMLVSPTWVQFNLFCMALLGGSPRRLSLADSQEAPETQDVQVIVAGAKFHRGQKVKVVVGTRDPDYGFPIGGWTGTIEKVFMDEPDGIFYEIRWDQRTLRLMGRSIRKKCERDGLDCDLMVLRENELKPG